MSVDPQDDCTFWYTQEYMPASGLWQTHIGSFKFPECGGPAFAACFEPSSSDAIYEFNKDGLWLIGDTRGGSCGEDNPIIGWVYEGHWVLARDIPSGTPSCVESTFYWGDMSKNYAWINSSGGTGTGLLNPCSAMEGETIGDDALPTYKETLEAAVCLEDQWGNQYNVTVSGMYIEGTVDHTSCGTVPLIGMVKDGLFSIYVDVPSGTSGCAEGYVVAAQVSSISGVWHNADDPMTGSIQFTSCTSAAELEPHLGLGPGEK